MVQWVFVTFNDLLILVFALTCPTTTNFFYLKYITVDYRPLYNHMVVVHEKDSLNSINCLLPQHHPV